MKTVRELSEESGMNKQNLFKLVKKLGVKTISKRTPEANNQQMLHISDDDYNMILKMRQDFTKKAVKKSEGFIYLVYTFPELCNKRVKIGYTWDLEDRLSQHRTVAPTLKLVKSWPCRKYHEGLLLDIMENESGIERVGIEVFDVQDIQALVNKIDNVFKAINS